MTTKPPPSQTRLSRGHGPRRKGRNLPSSSGYARNLGLAGPSFSGERRSGLETPASRYGRNAGTHDRRRPKFGRRAGQGGFRHHPSAQGRKTPPRASLRRTGSGKYDDLTPPKSEEGEAHEGGGPDQVLAPNPGSFLDSFAGEDFRKGEIAAPLGKQGRTG